MYYARKLCFFIMAMINQFLLKFSFFNEMKKATLFIVFQVGKNRYCLYIITSSMPLFNPFSTNVPPLYPLKKSEDRRFSDVFRGYRSEKLDENGCSKSLKVVSRLMKLLIILGNIYLIFVIQIIVKLY